MNDQQLRECVADLLAHIESVAANATSKEAATMEAGAMLPLRKWLENNAENVDLTPELMRLIFAAGLACGPEHARRGLYFWRSFHARLRDKQMRDLVQSELDGGAKNITTARRAVAERMGVDPRTVLKATKNI